MEIKSVTLQTTHLKKTKEFYVESLGFPLIKETQNSFRIGIGSSELEFTSENVKGHPFYHFAFNIPSNQFQEAKNWLQERTTLLLEDGEDEVNFSFWPAHACYFEDPAGNIVEFIARYKENPESESPFSINSILNISEISLVVKDAPAVGEQLKEINIFESDNEPITNTTLSFMQEKKKGVFIVLTGEGRRWLFSEKKSKIFPLEIELDNHVVLGVNNKLDFFINKRKERKLHKKD